MTDGKSRMILTIKRYKVTLDEKMDSWVFIVFIVFCLFFIEKVLACVNLG